MASFDLVIPGWHPARLNELISNRHKAGRLKKWDRLHVGYYSRIQAIPKAKVKRRVSLAITLGKGQRGGDQDAYWKSVNDALVKAGLLVDDTVKWVELGLVTFDRGPRSQTTIMLEDL